MKRTTTGLMVITLAAFMAVTVAFAAACGSSNSANPVGPSGQPTVTALDVTGSATVTVPQTIQFTATARLSDGTTQNVTTSASWQSSNVAVVTISSLGVVTAVQPGTATITAIYQALSRSFTVTSASSVPSHGSGTVRVLYVSPQDRAYRSDYATAVWSAVADVKEWYRGQLGGRTFTTGASLETCRLSRNADYYIGNGYNKVLQDVQACAPVSLNSQVFTWVLYVDVENGCPEAGGLGAGGWGVTILGKPDLNGLIGAPTVWGCGDAPSFPVSRFLGGLGHELGHALLLPHPPGCDQGLPSCDSKAIMWTGLYSYPNTYFRPDDKTILLNSPFIR